MERELWLELYRTLASLDGPKPSRRFTFADAQVAGVLFWAALHDRPVSWAADAGNWPAEALAAAGGRVPDQSTMSRRLRTAGVRDLLGRLHARLAGDGGAGDLVKVADSKPLPVGAYSVARDARWGRSVRGFCRGYKLHALWGSGVVPVAFEVVPMNASEQRVAKRLFRHLRGGGYVLADSVYDVNALYELAAAMNHRLVSKRKRPGAGLGKGRRGGHAPDRVRAIDALEGPCPAFGRQLYALRSGIERRFGRLTNFGGGLAPLPNWVRTLPRVRLWVTCKVLIAGIRTLRLQRDAA